MDANRVKFVRSLVSEALKLFSLVIYVVNLARGSRMSGFGSETRPALMEGVREKQ